VTLLLRNRADPNLVNDRGETALHHVSASGDADIVKALIEHNAWLERRNADGRTALHLATIRHSKNSVAALLAAQPDVDAKDGMGWTPLHYAVFERQVDIVRLLLEAGADQTIISNDGFTPTLLAQRHGDIRIQDLFSKITVIHKKPTRVERPRFQNPAPPQRIDVCKYFKALLWSPTPTGRFVEPPVLDMLYATNFEGFDVMNGNTSSGDMDAGAGIDASLGRDGTDGGSDSDSENVSTVSESTNSDQQCACRSLNWPWRRGMHTPSALGSIVHLVAYASTETENCTFPSSMLINPDFTFSRFLPRELSQVVLRSSCWGFSFIPVTSSVSAP